MNYKDLENISYLSQQILTEAAFEEYDVMNRWPYSSPYLQEERAPGVKPYRPQPTQAEVRADAAKAAKEKTEAGKDKPGYGPEEKFKDWKLRSTPSSTSRRRDGSVVTVSQRMDGEKPYATRPFSPLFTKQGSRTASAVTRATEGPGEPQAVTMPRHGRKKKKPSREIVRRKPKNEEFELWVNSLLDEGYDLSDYSWDDMYEIYLNEAEGSYGQTPKANLRYSNLAREGNKAAAKHAKRTDTRETPGERETRIRRTGMTQADRTYNRGAAEYGSTAYDPEEMDEPSGPGGMPKGKKLARQRKRGVSAESYDLYDLILAHLIDEGYSETPEAATAIMANMSEGWVDAIVDSYIQE